MQSPDGVPKLHQMLDFVLNCKHTEAHITSIYFHFNQSRFSFEPGCTSPQNSVLSLGFDTVIFYHTHATFNDLVSTLLQGELTQFATRTFPQVPRAFWHRKSSSIILYRSPPLQDFLQTFSVRLYLTIANILYPIFSTVRQLINTVLTRSRLNFCVTLGQQIPDRKAEWASPAAVCKRELWTPHWYSVHGTQPNPLSDQQNGNKTNGPAGREERKSGSRKTLTSCGYICAISSTFSASYLQPPGQKEPPFFLITQARTEAFND